MGGITNDTSAMLGGVHCAEGDALSNDEDVREADMWQVLTEGIKQISDQTKPRVQTLSYEAVLTVRAAVFNLMQSQCTQLEKRIALLEETYDCDLFEDSTFAKHCVGNGDFLSTESKLPSLDCAGEPSRRGAQETNILAFPPIEKKGDSKDLKRDSSEDSVESDAETSQCLPEDYSMMAIFKGADSLLRKMKADLPKPAKKTRLWLPDEAETGCLRERRSQLTNPDESSSAVSDLLQGREFPPQVPYIEHKRRCNDCESRWFCYCSGASLSDHKDSKTSRSLTSPDSSSSQISLASEESAVTPNVTSTTSSYWTPLSHLTEQKEQ